jgi:hypothetical protein
MSAKRSPQEVYDSIFEQLLDGIESSRPEELAAESRANGENVEKVAQAMKSALLAGVRKFTQRNLEQARRVHKARTRMLSRTATSLPASPLERRSLLVSWAQKSGAQLTARFRDLSSLTDDDVTSALEELMQLEALEKAQSETDDNSK